MAKLTKPTRQTVEKDDDILHVNPVVEWLLKEGWTATDSTTLIEGLAVRLVAQGIPLSRLLVFIHSLLPREMISLGFHTLRGVGAPEEIFTLPADEG